MKMNWVAYSLMAAIAFTGMILIYKKLLLMGINQNVLNLIIFGLVFLGFTSMIVVTKTPVKVSAVMFGLLLLAAVFSLLGNYFQVKSYQEAPNPGYSSTLVATQLVLITVFSVFLFNAELNWLKFVGIVVVIVGSYLISL